MAKPEILLEAENNWPAAIPAATSAILLFAGIRLLYLAVIDRGGRLPFIMAGLWISGSSVFADVVLRLVEWRWPATWAPLVVFYVLAAVVIRSEWRHRPGYAMRLTFAVLWPWLGWPGLPVWFGLVNGTLGTAALIACSIDSTWRYRPPPLGSHIIRRPHGITDDRSNCAIRWGYREIRW